MPELPVPVSENLAPSESTAESVNNGTTFALAGIAILLVAVYFAISVLVLPR